LSLVNVFKSIQQNNYSNALNQLRRIRVQGTSISAYRKIHSLITSSLEKLVAINPSNVTADILTNILSELTSTALLIEYQKERRLISNDIADGLYRVILDLIREIEACLTNLNRGTSSIDRDRINKVQSMARAIKVIIDGIVALNYRYFSRT